MFHLHLIPDFTSVKVRVSQDRRLRPSVKLLVDFETFLGTFCFLLDESILKPKSSKSPDILGVLASRGFTSPLWSSQHIKVYFKCSISRLGLMSPSALLSGYKLVSDFIGFPFCSVIYVIMYFQLFFLHVEAHKCLLSYQPVTLTLH